MEAYVWVCLKILSSSLLKPHLQNTLINVVNFLSKDDIKILALSSKELLGLSMPCLVRDVTYRVPHNVRFTKFVHTFALLRPHKVYVFHASSIPKSATCVELAKNFVGDSDSLPSHIRQLYFNYSQANLLVDHLPPFLAHLGLDAQFNRSVDNLPPHLTHLTFSRCVFNQSVDHLPHSLSHLIIDSSSFNQPVDQLPPNLLFLSLHGSSSFNQPVDHLPLTLTHLALHGKFNQPLDYLPPSLTHLHLVGSFDLPIDHLPSSLVYLNISGDFDHEFDHLPHSLTYLRIFANKGNHPVDNLPLSLTHLYLESNLFNKSIDHLPSSLAYLSLGDEFNQLVDYLPLSLVYLTFKFRFNQPIDNLPLMLTHLGFLGANFNQPIYDIPPLLTHLAILGKEFDSPIENLPQSIVHLTLNHSHYPFHNPEKLPCILQYLQFSLPAPNSKSICLDHLFQYELFGLTHLTLFALSSKHGEYQHITFPSSITNLSIRGVFTGTILLPRFITKLQLPHSYNQPITLPPSLIEVEFGSSFNHEIFLPISLKYVKFGDNFNNWIFFPSESVVSDIIFGREFNQPLTKLPNTVKLLVFGSKFTETLTLPRTLKLLVIPPSYYRKLYPNSTTQVIITTEWNGNRERYQSRALGCPFTERGRGWSFPPPYDYFDMDNF